MFESANWCIIVNWEDRRKYNLMRQHSIFTAFFVCLIKNKKKCLTIWFSKPVLQNTFKRQIKTYSIKDDKFIKDYSMNFLLFNHLWYCCNWDNTYYAFIPTLWNQNKIRCSTVWQFQCIFFPNWNVFVNAEQIAPFLILALQYYQIINIY